MAEPVPAPLRPTARFLLGAIVTLDLLYVVNCIAPYIGLKYEFAQAMFSMLTFRADNHLFIPAVPLFDVGRFVHVSSAEATGRAEPVARKFTEFVRWADTNGRSVHINFLRYQMDRICGAAPGDRIRLKLREGGVERVYDNACDEPSLRGHYRPGGLYEPCDPECNLYLRAWASGRPYKE
jgi:hypothetical protein